ncbi:MAG: ATP-binding protein [Anaerolineae bacterium]|nr:ATP-binding protein [Anaerolineae bacterium]
MAISHPLRQTPVINRTLEVKNNLIDHVNGLHNGLHASDGKQNNGNGRGPSDMLVNDRATPNPPSVDLSANIAMALLKLPDQHSDWLRWLRLTQARAAILAFPCELPVFSSASPKSTAPSEKVHHQACDLLIIAAHSIDNALSNMVGTRITPEHFPPIDIQSYADAQQPIKEFDLWGGGTLILVEAQSAQLGPNLAEYWLDAFNVALEKAAEHHQLEQAKQVATELSLAKSRFLSMMSYEIRTPMNAIMGMTELLLDTQLDEQQREFALITYESSEALVQILGDVVDYAKLESSGLDMDYAPFMPKDTVNNTIKLVESKITNKAIKLDPAFEFGLPNLVLGDAGRVRQVLMSLIFSMTKFTKSGSIIIRVTQAASTPASTTLRFDVRSSDAYIPQEMLDYLLSPFSTRETATSKQYIGVRLALSVAAKIAQRMNGDFKFEPTKPTGWLFSFTGVFGLQTTAP